MIEKKYDDTKGLRAIEKEYQGQPLRPEETR